VNTGKPEVPLKKQDSKKGKGKKASAKTSTDSSQPVIIDYMSKEQFAMSAPVRSSQKLLLFSLHGVDGCK
jgi:hypothetical protein